MIAPGARPLEDLITDLMSGVIGLASGTSRQKSGVRPVSVEFDLPIETRLASVPGSVVVRADVPQSRTRTAFDLPLGRLAMRVIAEAQS